MLGYWEHLGSFHLARGEHFQYSGTSEHPAYNSVVEMFDMLRSERSLFQVKAGAETPLWYFNLPPNENGLGISLMTTI